MVLLPARPGARKFTAEAGLFTCWIMDALSETQQQDQSTEE